MFSFPLQQEMSNTYIQDRLKYFEELRQRFSKMVNQQVQIKITLPDGGIRDFSNDVTLYEMAKSIVKSSKIYSKFVGALVDGVPTDLSDTLNKDASIKFLTFDDKEGKQIFWHSSAHVLGAALERLYYGHLGHGPALDNGYFYDVYLNEQKISIDDAQLPIIAEKQKEFVQEATKSKSDVFEKLMIPKEECLTLFSYSKLKQELIRDHVVDGEMCSVYKCHDFIDFCRGPHLYSLQQIGAFSAMSCSAAYFKGDQKRETMQRVYGVSFPTDALLKSYLEEIEEAKRRDHRVIAKEMELFTIHKYAPGMPLFQNNGTIIYRTLEGFIRDLLHRYHYIEVQTPNFFNTDMWKVSGHYDHYIDNMYLLQRKDPADPLYGLKPMNCPGHCLIYGSAHRSKSDLPIRMSEFGVVHRLEVSGALSGLTRVCRFEQDDAHIFCAADQIHSEITGIIKFIKEAYEPFQLSFAFTLSLRPDDRIGSDELWDTAENALRDVLTKSGFKFTENPGDGAFYGPKIDIHLTDALNRQHQCGTIQLDFNMPSQQRFDLQYADFKDGQQIYSHPVMIHRAILGSIERFMAIMIENCSGRFPFWICPRQVLILSLRSDFDQYAQQVYEKVWNAGFNASVDVTAEKIQKKLAKGFSEKYNFILVVGGKEQESGSANVQGRTLSCYDKITDKPEKHSRVMKLDEFLDLCKDLKLNKQPF